MAQEAGSAHATRAPWRPERAEWALLGGLCLVFAPAFAAMAEVWRTVDYTSHGFLVPVVSLWAAMRDRYAFPRDHGARDPRGLLVLAGALVLYVLGIFGDTLFLQGVAFVVALAGAVSWRRGAAWLRALAFPIAFLVFMVPPPPTLTTPVIVQLQLFVSTAAIACLHAFGIPIAQEGNVLVLPGGDTLFVAEACSGVTSLITLTPLAVVLARYALRGLPWRLLLVAAVVPFAMFGNLVRVVGTVVGARHLGLEAVTAGPIHEAAGLATYVVSCGLLLGAAAALRQLERRS